MWRRASGISDDDLTSFTIEEDLVSVSRQPLILYVTVSLLRVLFRSEVPLHPMVQLFLERFASLR